MAGVHSFDAASGHFSEPAAQGATNATAGITTGDAAALLPTTGTRAYLEVSAAAQGCGAEGVYSNGRYREHGGGPRLLGSGSRDSSAERIHGAGNAPCGIMKNAMVSFKELCGLNPAANMKQCILTVSSWLMNSERSLRVTVDLSETYPTMEAQGPVPELLRKVLNAYDMMIQTSRTLIESADVVHSKLTQAQRAGLDFHEDLHRIGAKEGLKGRKLQKAMESYAWNITVLKGQADLLKHAKSEALDTLRQIHCAAQSCGLSKNGAASPQLQHHPHHQPLQVQMQQQQQPQAKPHPQPPAPPMHQSQTQPQSQITPQAYFHPQQPPAYPQPPPLTQLQLQFQGQQQRAAGPLEVVPEKETVSDGPARSC